MTAVRILIAVAIATTIIGCSLGNDEGTQVAISIVQDFKPSNAQSSIGQLLSAANGGDWTATKTSETLYRVMFHGSANGRAKELVFGVNINKRDVMALNRDALAYTNPL